MALAYEVIFLGSTLAFWASNMLSHFLMPSLCSITIPQSTYTAVSLSSFTLPMRVQVPPQQRNGGIIREVGSLHQNL